MLLFLVAANKEVKDKFISTVPQNSPQNTPGSKPTIQAELLIIFIRFFYQLNMAVGIDEIPEILFYTRIMSE